MRYIIQQGRMRVSEPAEGLVRAVRKTLGMTARQLAKRAGISQQAVSRIEADELNNKLTLQTMMKMAEALGCKFEYSFTPKGGSFENILSAQAQTKGLDVANPNKRLWE